MEGETNVAVHIAMHELGHVARAGELVKSDGSH